jgi:polysaccharide deacetylase 2 family uncharacterized protein YibQ
MLKTEQTLPRRQRRRKSGPRPLIMAWVGLLLAITAGGLFFLLTPPQENKEDALMLSIDNAPEQFAPVDWANQAAAQANLGQENLDEANLSETVSSPTETTNINEPTTNTTDPNTEPAETNADMTGLRDEILPSGARRITLPNSDEQEDGTTSDMAEVLDELGDGAVVIHMSDGSISPDKNAASQNGDISARAGQKIISQPPGALERSFDGLGDYGPTPKVASDGRRPSRHYARGFSAPDDMPKIAIIIAGLGLDSALTDAAISLPPEVTLAFAPYAKNLPAKAARARARGHELLVELPMEAAGLGPEQLGPAALTTFQSQADNRKRLDWVLSRFKGFYGVTNYLGGTFSSDQTAITPVLFALKGSGLAYIDDTGLARRSAQSMSASYGSVDFLLTPQSADFAGMLDQIEQRALAKTRITVKVYATPASLQQLQIWIDGFEEKGIVLAPASALVDNL